MKKLSNIFLLAFVMMSLFSCKKDFLNEPTPKNGDLTDNIIFSTKNGARSALTGTYWIFRSENYNGYGGGGPGILTNRGLQTTMFHFEMKGNDLLDIYAGTYWWGNEATWAEGYYNRDANGSRTPQVWDMFYKVINNANAIIKNTPGITDASDEEKTQFIAEARALRAYSYFWLARVYQKSYAVNPDAPGIPVYTEPANKDAEGNKRASLKEVYALITADIEFAVTHLTADRSEKFIINLNVAQAIAAMIYQELAMAEPSLWEKVITNAKGAVNGYPLMSNAQYKAGFNSLANPEWIWGAPVPSDQSLTYYSQFSYIDQTNGYYKNIYANVALYNSYSATDERRTLLISPGYSPTTYPLYQRYTNKFKSRTAGVMEGDLLYIRSAQLVLIEAEAYAQKGETQNAIDKLYTLQVLRDPSAVKMASSATKDEVINAILSERSKEMYGENGGLYFDYKRLRKTFVRTGNHPNKVTIEPDDVRWLLKIPQKEINANVQLTEADQNP
ncbi:SusD-like starch-binding protein associating with outer membrane [Chitinophaga skermanii]|uniref:SusD-like starch-binding protein associating with outer membrane n=1 Tax=Chitinophaga skermanii TaxID=331697 RepID=A0A327QS61_9BACT|nr:RagB/SusD family nutrient uptake outer membrane protein [Chitinophaga skermanii]RAJ06484.1 SusD-like starch-binding protein associating with outer membrane [Chitinophaga skermanii]